MVTNNQSKTPKFKNYKAQQLRENNPERCMEILLSYQHEKERGSRIGKLPIDEFVALHADLDEGQLPWPGDVQDALTKAGL